MSLSMTPIDKYTQTLCSLLRLDNPGGADLMEAAVGDKAAGSDSGVNGTSRLLKNSEKC
jgi:hypothetical protein